ncbi:PTS sugar transporter subunit IIA [Numidum massiliense]|uniref:PTS sugar transporter subunit IIA n=1 Tax=Numidum massiliense TaxID=1522315 RepID=UPI0006D56002|nr:PTS sugar transporter subunit IIA [Numidum massiliense]
MRYFLFATHGRFATGILDSVELITGKHDNILTINAYTDENDDLDAQIAQVLSRLATADELVVVTDLFSGSVNNAFMNRLDDERIHLVAGLNLPLAIELVTMSAQEPDTVKLIETALNSSKQSIKYCNQELHFERTDDDF